LSASITVDTAAEINQLFLEFQSAGVNFYQELKKEPSGARNFIVLDPDGSGAEVGDRRLDCGPLQHTLVHLLLSHSAVIWTTLEAT
jgi:hypothetical protein